jgi:hypothetical protein
MNQHCQRKHLTKILQGSDQQGKGYLEDVDCDCKDQEPVLLRSDMWSYGKATNMKVEHNSQTDSNAE